MPARSPALTALTAAEKGALLDALLDARPDLRRQAEELATQQLSGVNPIGGRLADVAVRVLHDPPLPAGQLDADHPPPPGGPGRIQCA